MTLALLFYIIAIVMFVLSAFGIPSGADLFKLAWAFVIAAVAFGGYVLH